MDQEDRMRFVHARNIVKAHAAGKTVLAGRTLRADDVDRARRELLELGFDPQSGERWPHWNRASKVYPIMSREDVEAFRASRGEGTAAPTRDRNERRFGR